jgi:hypothetical protein
MEYKRLFIFVEGDDDDRFFQRIIKPKCEEKYDSVTLWKYAQVKDRKCDNFIKSVKAMNADYICAVDINHAPCVTGRKQEIQDKFKNIDEDKIIVIIKEIESWYLAGLDKGSLKNLGITGSFETTDDVAKEQFNGLIPKKFDSRIDFMLELLKGFSIEIAKQKNKTLQYFFEKHLLL